MRLARIAIMTGILICLCTIFAKLVTGEQISVFDLLIGYRATILFSAILVIVVAIVLLVLLRGSLQFHKAYRLHRLLLEAEMTLQEQFLRLSPGGVDRRRDRMLDIMRAAEECQTKPVVLMNHDKGSVQKTARGIISADQNDLSGYRTKRRSARINAFALEALLKGRLLAARNHILQSQLNALQSGSSLPEILPALAELLKIEIVSITEAQILKAQKDKNPFGTFPAAIGSAVRFFRHPKELVYTDSEGNTLSGWAALQAMRKV